MRRFTVGTVIAHADTHDSYILLVVGKAPNGRWNCLVLMDSLNHETAGQIVTYTKSDITRYFERLG